jgi:replication factor C subunit 3/5
MSLPWIEKYRPTSLENVVLSESNYTLFHNIIKFDYVPNILVYGPPGTGKTTTIINLINEYQKKNGIQTKELIIHLNASDDRGIDVVRNQIQQFVKSRPLFLKGLKFIILDEVDYMTKTAQQALRHLIQEYTNVRFFLICNYISKIDSNLQSEFLNIKMNKLPQMKIIEFLQNIVSCEQLSLTTETLLQIQENYHSDVRSMINFMQTKQNEINIQIITDAVWDDLYATDSKKISDKVNNISTTFNLDKKTIIKKFLNYIIINHEKCVTTDFLTFVENIIHSNVKTDYIINYFIKNIQSYIHEDKIDYNLKK